MKLKDCHKIFRLFFWTASLSHNKDGIEITAKQFETLKSYLTAVDNEIEQQKQHRQAPGQVQVQVMSWSYFNGENI